jgi:hypothetical protein
MWRDIPGYEGTYQVSSVGRVKRLIGYQCRKERILKSARNCKGKGYPFVVLCKQGKTKEIPIHQMVAWAFIGPQEDKEVNHIDGNKLNNNLKNLEYLTHQENMQHARAIGLTTYFRGEKAKVCRILDKDIKEARQRFASNPNSTVKEIALFLGVSQPYASTLLSGRMRPEAGGPFKTEDRRWKRE